MCFGMLFCLYCLFWLLFIIEYFSVICMVRENVKLGVFFVIFLITWFFGYLSIKLGGLFFTLLTFLCAGVYFVLLGYWSDDVPKADGQTLYLVVFVYVAFFYLLYEALHFSLVDSVWFSLLLTVVAPFVGSLWGEYV